MYILIGAEEGYTNYVFAAPSLERLLELFREATVREEQTARFSEDVTYARETRAAMEEMLAGDWAPGWHYLKPVEPIWQETSLLVIPSEAAFPDHPSWMGPGPGSILL